MRVVALAVVRHDQRPRGERHKFPGAQKGESIIGEEDQIHGGQEGRKERQHPPGAFSCLP